MRVKVVCIKMSKSDANRHQSQVCITKLLTIIDR